MLLPNLNSGFSWFLGVFFIFYFFKFLVCVFFLPQLLSWFQICRSPEALPEAMPGMTSFQAFLATGLFVSNSNMQMLF